MKKHILTVRKTYKGVYHENFDSICKRSNRFAKRFENDS